VRNLLESWCSKYPSVEPLQVQAGARQGQSSAHHPQGSPVRGWLGLRSPGESGSKEFCDRVKVIGPRWLVRTSCGVRSPMHLRVLAIRLSQICVNAASGMAVSSVSRDRKRHTQLLAFSTGPLCQGALGLQQWFSIPSLLWSSPQRANVPDCLAEAGRPSACSPRRLPPQLHSDPDCGPEWCSGSGGRPARSGWPWRGLGGTQSDRPNARSSCARRSHAGAAQLCCQARL
jgi:hypothetical protein